MSFPLSPPSRFAAADWRLGPYLAKWHRLRTALCEVSFLLCSAVLAWPFGKARESAPLPSAVPHSPVSRLGGPGLRPGSSPCSAPPRSRVAADTCTAVPSDGLRVRVRVRVIPFVIHRFRWEDTCPNAPPYHQQVETAAPRGLRGGLGVRVGGVPRMLTEVPSPVGRRDHQPVPSTFYAQARSWTGSAFTPAGRSSIDEIIFMYFNNNLGDRLDR